MLAALAIQHFNGSSKCNGYRVSWTCVSRNVKASLQIEHLGNRFAFGNAFGLTSGAGYRTCGQSNDFQTQMATARPPIATVSRRVAVSDVQRVLQLSSNASRGGTAMGVWSLDRRLGNGARKRKSSNSKRQLDGERCLRVACS